MARSKVGSRHPLLMYRRTMDRVWRASLLLAVLLFASGVWSLLGAADLMGFNSEFWLLITAFLAFLLGIFAFFSRFLAYVQAREDHLKISTPFLKLKISYQRILSVHPALMQQIFPPDEASWAQRNFLEPFYGQTVLVVELRGFPIDPVLLRLFLPAQMFSPQTKGFVIMVADWMHLSTEFDSLHGAWLQNQGRKKRAQHSIR